VKFLSIWMPDPATPSGPPDAAHIEIMGRLVGEMMSEGVLLETGGVEDGHASLRVTRREGATTVLDGPFAESKELIGGYALLRVNSKEEAVAVAERFMAFAGNGTCELHEVSEWD